MVGKSEKAGKGASPMVFRFDYNISGLGYHHTREPVPVPSDFARHFHDGYELIFISEGHGRFIVEGSEYEISPGSFLFFRPREYHYVDIRPGEPYERRVFHFNRQTLVPGAEAFLDLLDSSPFGEGNYYRESDLPPGFSDLIRGFDSVADLSEDYKPVFAQVRLSELVIMLATSNAHSGSLISERLGGRVVRYLNEHIETDETIEDLANRFSVSKFYLCRTFKEHNGISIHGYITRKRVMIAKSRIDDGMTAAAAAAGVGFRDYSAFYRAYRRIVGRSPSEKRESRKD